MLPAPLCNQGVTVLTRCDSAPIPTRNGVRPAVRVGSQDGAMPPTASKDRRRRVPGHRRGTEWREGEVSRRGSGHHSQALLSVDP
jgi:hypothetical protein